jgi:glycerol kinase
MTNRSSPIILAVDQGTSGTKAVLFSVDGRILASRTADYAINHPRPGYVEIDPSDLLDSVDRACRSAIEDYESDGGRRSDIHVLGISNQRESFLFWDDDGRAASPIVVWQCKRSAEYCKRLSEDREFSKLIRNRTGLVVDPYFSGTKAAVQIRNDPELAGRLAAGEIRFGTVDSWMIWHLTGGQVHATDLTNASRTMLFDIHRLRWDEDILSRFRLTGLRMPDVRPSDAGFGSTDLGGLLDCPIPIGGVVGDSHAAAFGEGLFQPGEAKVTLGTGSSILLNTGGKPVPSSNGMVTTICWSTRERTDYALEGIVVSCGSTITWLRDKMEFIRDSREIDVLAEEVEDPEGVYFIPGFSGIGAPWWYLNAKASIVGLDLGHDRRHIARAALESIPFQITDVLGAMARDTAARLRGIKADGGITVSRIVVNALSSLMDCPVVVPEMAQASAWGAALAAGLHAGLYPDLAAIDSLIQSSETRAVDIPPDVELGKRYEG